MCDQSKLREEIEFVLCLGGQRYSERIMKKLLPRIYHIENKIEENRNNEEYFRVFEEVAREGKIEICNKDDSPGQVLKRTMNLPFFKRVVVAECHNYVRRVQAKNEGKRPSFELMYYVISHWFGLPNKWVKKTFEKRERRGGFFGGLEDKPTGRVIGVKEANGVPIESLIQGEFS